VQRAGIVALKEGEPVIARTLARFRGARDFLVRQLNATEGITAALPEGTMYAFFKVQGMEDSLEFCKRLVRDVGLGLAPGSAFGPAGEGFVRWCFAASEERLAEGLGRLRKAMVR
jgi:aspartate/methionine/tyrosine aminotransferase